MILNKKCEHKFIRAIALNGETRTKCVDCGKIITLEEINQNLFGEKPKNLDPHK